MTDFGRKAAPSAHAALHENGGADEISVASLSGELSDNQPPLAHALAGTIHDADTLADLNLKVSDATLDTSSASRTPSAHKTSHQSGESDEINIGGLSGAIDHGGLSGRDDDDHSLYHTNARGDARYPLLFYRYDNFIHAYAYKAIIQGTWSFSTISTALFNYVINNDTNAINDEIEYQIFAEDGVKTLQLVGGNSTAGAIVSVYLDDVLQGTIDQYRNPNLFSKIETLAVTVVGTGIHSLKFKATSHHGSSSGYAMYITTARIY